MLAVLIALAQAPCPPDAVALMAEASVRAEAFDLSGAAGRMRMAANLGCPDADIAALYLGGVVDAREAFRQGAPPDTLTPVRNAIASLQMIARDRPGAAEVARLLLQAAAAAAQSERDEMRLYLEEARRMESLLHQAGQPGAPMLGSLEVAGDLWLQVHRYADAQRAYMLAAEQDGGTLRVLAGLARTAARLGDTAAACAGYRTLLNQWGQRQAEPPEIADARAYLRQLRCQPVPAR